MGSSGGEKERRGHGVRAGGEPRREADRCEMGYFCVLLGFCFHGLSNQGRERREPTCRGEKFAMPPPVL